MFKSFDIYFTLFSSIILSFLLFQEFLDQLVQMAMSQLPPDMSRMMNGEGNQMNGENALLLFH